VHALAIGMSITHHIGLEITEHAFRFVELRRQDGQTAILRADVHETARDYSSPLFFDIPFNHELAKDFISDLATVFNAKPVYASNVSLILPSLLPLVATIPVESDLSAESLRAVLEWECATLYGMSTGTRMVVLTHALPHSGNSTPTLIVALPHACVHFLTTIFSHLTLALDAIDIDHFVMENCVRDMYPHDTHGRYAVMGIFDDHCSVGLYSGSQYLGHALSETTYKQHLAAQTLRLLEDIPAFHTGQLQRVWCYGNAFDSHIATVLERVLHAPVTRCMPLLETDVTDALRSELEITGEATFDAAAAAALLGL